MTIVQKFFKKNSVEVLSPFLGRCILNDLFLVLVHVVGPKNGSYNRCKNGSCSGRKNGLQWTYAPKGFIKILMTDVERARARGVQNFWGPAEIERARGTTEAGAFGP